MVVRKWAVLASRLRDPSALSQTLGFLRIFLAEQYCVVIDTHASHTTPLSAHGLVDVWVVPRAGPRGRRAF